MQVQVEDVDLTKIATVQFSKTEVDRELDAIALRIKPQVAPKGFRKNHAPLDVIKKLYHKVILAEASTKLVLDGSQEILRRPELQNSVNPQLLPEFRPTESRPYAGEFHLDGTFLFKVKVELPPQIEVKGYRGIEVAGAPPTFEYWVTKQLAAEQVKYGSRVAVARPAAMSDYVSVDFQAFVAGEPLEHGTETDFQLLLGGGTFPTEFEQAFVGQSAGGEIKFSCQFPEGYSNPVFAGQAVTFQGKLNEVLEIRPHPANDQLAALLGFETLDALREYQKETWNQEFEKSARANTYNVILDKLLEANPFVAPEVWVDGEYQNVLRRLSLQQAPTDPAMVASLRELATRSVKSAYLLDKIYEKERSCNLTPAEFKELLEDEAKKQNLTTDELLEQLRKRQQYEGVVAFYEHSKAVDFLIENAVYRE